MRKQVRSRFIAIAALATLIGGLSACAKVPQEAIDAANASLQAAKDAGAATYAADSLRAAEDALNTATAEVEAQGGKFALLRSYDEASQLLSQASEAAASAKTDAEQNREKARLSAEAAILAAQSAITSAKSAVDVAPAGKGTRTEIEAMRSELATLEAALAQASEMYEAGDYLGALARAESVKSEADAISSDVAQAQAKRGRV
jgi:hypothetical protein